MKHLGVKVSGGISLAHSYYVDATLPNIDLSFRIENDQVDTEIYKVDSAIKSVINDYDEVITDLKSGDIKELVEFNKMMLMAESLKNEVNNLIKEQFYPATLAVKTYFDKQILKLEQADNPYLQERGKDIKDACDKIIRNLLNIKEFDPSNLKEDVILVSKEITPSMLLSENLEHIKGIVSEIGGRTSHVGILANTLEIPAVFGITNINKTIKNNEIIFVNGNNGSIETFLSSEQIEDYENQIIKESELKKELYEFKDKSAITKDGKRFDVSVNTGDITDLERLSKLNCDGIGLFRTEFLYLNRKTPPTEEILFNTYKNFAELTKQKPFIIRTLDIGGDKKASYININDEANPFLGYRAIRYCLDNKEFFKSSLRAILRSSHYGNVMIMYPMISSLEEIRQANSILEEAKKELDLENIPYNKNIKVGIMVEIPTAAISLDLWLNEIDFVSIGTNDLVQYTLAVDRVNPTVSKLYTYYNPGVLRLINYTITSTHKYPDKFVGMCGEMASDPLGIILLIGMGLNEFSVNISSVLKVKKFISLIDSQEAEKLVSDLLNTNTSELIEQKLSEYAKKIYGKYYE